MAYRAQGVASIDGRIVYDTNLNVRSRLQAAFLLACIN